jgi:leader peptidase (prepilin peptidase) / N-methyltransferase
LCKRADHGASRSPDASHDGPAAPLTVTPRIGSTLVRLPNALTSALIFAGVGVTMVYDRAAVPDHAAAAVAGYLTVRAIEIGYRRGRGHDGFGQGDAKLLAAEGAFPRLMPLSIVVPIATVCSLADQFP